MTDDVDHFILDRNGQRRLREKLAIVPRLVEDVAMVETRQAVQGRRDLGMSRRPKKLGARIPMHLGAAAAAQDLRNSLILAVRHTCEQRSVDFMPVGYTHVTRFIGPLQPGQRRIPLGYDEGSPLVTAKWLWRNIISFAMTESCGEFASAILGAIAECEHQIDGPDEGVVVITSARLEAANRQVVTVSTIDTIARQLGDRGKGLNGRRIRTLVKHELLHADGEDPETGTKFYRLGDVLEAHQKLKQRSRAS